LNYSCISDPFFIILPMSNPWVCACCKCKDRKVCWFQVQPCISSLSVHMATRLTNACRCHTSALAFHCRCSIMEVMAMALSSFRFIDSVLRSWILIVWILCLCSIIVSIILSVFHQYNYYYDYEYYNNRYDHCYRYHPWLCRLNSRSSVRV